jgi:hypothetical protein
LANNLQHHLANLKTKNLNLQERKKRIIARGEFSDHCHVITGEVEFDIHGRIIVNEDSNAVLKHLLETDWLDGKETWTGEHTDIKLTPGTYEYVHQIVFDPLTKRIEQARD